MIDGTKALEEAAVLSGRTSGTVGGTIGGALANAGFEKLRQSVNFEDDNALILEAGLIGGVLSAPFAYLHSKEMTQLATTANLEHRVLTAARKDRAGESLTADDLSAIDELSAKTKRVSDIEMGRVDAGSTYQGGSVGSGQAVPLGVEPTVFANARLDIYKTLNTQPNLVLQELAHDLIKDPIGNSKFYAQGRTASEGKANVRRVLGGYFHREAREGFNEVRKIRGLGPVDAYKQHQEFFENVSRVVRGDAQVLIDNADIAGPLNKAADAMRHTYSELAKRAQKSGLEGAEGLVPNESYVNRVWNHNNIRTAIAAHGRAEVDRVLAAAIPGFRNDIGKAHSFLDAVRKLEFSHVLQDIQLMGKDMAALRAELSQHLQPSEIDSIVDIMFQAKKSEPDAGNPGNLKYRLDLDETYSERMANGTDLRISDLFENDSRLLVDKYINSMGGHIALAEKGYRSRGAFMKRMEDAKKYHAENQADTLDASQFNKSMQLMQDMYDNITGRPMSTQSFNNVDRFLGATRAYTRSAFLGQLGIAAAFELKNAIGLATVRAFHQQMPAFRELLGSMRSGRIPNEALAQDIEHMAGFGLERAAAYARQHEITEFTYDRGLSQFENVTNKAAHAVDIISGNAYFTSATRQLSAAMFLQKHVNLATGKLSITDKLRERLVHQGINSDDLDDVLAHLKDFTTRDPNGTVKEVQWEQWQQKHPDTYDNYVLALEREVRDAIQDQDIGETMPWMHTTTGKIWAELRTFTLVAHAKQFLKGAYYHDQTTAMTWTMAALGEALAYSTQTTINFAHNPEELSKRLSLERIAAAVVQRMSVLGVAPMILETGYWTASGGDSLFKSGGTTNTDNRNAFLTPSMIAAARMAKGVSTVAGAVNPMASSVTTQRDIKDLLGTLPGGNAWVMRNINDYVSSQFPKGEAARQ